MNQWNRRENAETNPDAHGQVIFGKMPRPFRGQKAVSSINGAGEVDIHMQKEKIGPLLNLIYKK